MSVTTEYLDGNSLSTETLVTLSKGTTQIDLTPEAWEKVQAGRRVVEDILSENKVAYGINTGFGLFSNVIIPPEKLRELQANLIRSHASGVGPPLPLHRTRMLLALRINVLAKGHSGISPESLQQAVDAFNRDCISVVPSQGTVGASGDLAPLSHLALGLMGEGKMWAKPAGREGPKEPTGNAKDVLEDSGLRPMVLQAKEGLAMINGTQMIGSLGAEAVQRAANVANCADVICALTLEVLQGTVNAFHPCIHKVRPHRGQGMVASRIRAILNPSKPSEIAESHKYCGRVQDAYSLRCAPQVHGICHDTVRFVDSVLSVELNSATDNPMVFQGDPKVTMLSESGMEVTWPPVHANIEDKESEKNSFVDQAKKEIQRLQSLVDKVEGRQPEVPHKAAPLPIASPAHPASSALYHDAEQPPSTLEDMQRKDQRSTLYQQGSGFVISGGNFHGEYPAKVLDYLAIGISEIAAISERRIERMVNPALSSLPAFLVKDGGLNSGFMIAHCTAAALVSENKVLAHPSSVDSISTSAAKEDHVSMGGFSARKAVDVVNNVEVVVAIELLAACQALEFHRPLHTTPCLEEIHSLVRRTVAKWDEDRIMYTDIDAATELVRSGAIWEIAAKHLRGYPGTEV